MLQRLIGEHIALTVTIHEGIAAVRADASQLEQVIMNLSINARDAMPGGGRLRIELANVVLDGAPMTSAARNVSGTERAQAFKPGRYVRLSVADTGSGMSPETLARVFEPFFTTKEEGRGTGLGLAMVYGIVEQAAGAIDVETAVDQGTAFHVYLPAVPESDAAADAQHVGSEGPANGMGDVRARGSETVLLVEAAHVATFIASALRAHGYTVVEAANAGEALEVIRDHFR